MKLYHYTSIESFCKIWVSKQLRFSKSQNTNDLFERSKPYSLNTLDIEQAKAFDKIYQEVMETYKQISFTKNYSRNGRNDGFSSPMMWGHYAHNEAGVCIEIEQEKLRVPFKTRMRSVRYTDIVPSLSFKCQPNITEEEIRTLIHNHIYDLFFIKHRHWKFENEYRMILRTTEESYIPLQNAVTSVIVYSTSGVNTDIVKHIVQEEVPIYALWDGGYHAQRNLDRIDLKRYNEIMSGGKVVTPTIPKLILKS